MTMTMYHGTAATAVSLALVAGLNACTSAPSDRTGGDTLVLRLATNDGEGVSPATNPGPFTFVEQLAEVSGGRVEVEVVWDYGDGAPTAESQVVEAIAAGEVDGGFPATRAFGRAGIEGLGAIEAPMLLTSEKAVEELVTGPVGERALAQLDGTDVIGMNLLAAPLRRPVSGTSRLVGPADWNGITFRVYNSSVQAETVRALGARPVDLTHAWAESMRLGDLDGAEIDLAAAQVGEEVKHVTGNVVLWPKVVVLALNRDRFDSLTEQQQGWVREAADRARDASVSASYDERLDLTPLCDAGTAVHEATRAQLTELKRSVRPVIEGLRRDPDTADLMREVEALAAAHPATDATEPSGGCRSADGMAEEVSSGVPSIPDGTYRAEIPVSATAQVGNDRGFSGIWTLVISDGTWAVSCRPLEDPGTDRGTAISDEPLDAGKLTGDDDAAWFTPDPEMIARLTGCELPPNVDDVDHCLDLPAFGATWELDGDVLSFSDLRGRQEYTMVLVPWRRID